MTRLNARRIPERVVQRQIVQLLRACGAAVYVLGGPRRRGDYPGTMQTPGLPDLFAFVGGTPLWIEVKAAGGRLRPEQAAFQAHCEACGLAHLVGGLDVVLAWLSARGLVERAHYRGGSDAAAGRVERRDCGGASGVPVLPGGPTSDAPRPARRAAGVGRSRRPRGDAAR